MPSHQKRTPGEPASRPSEARSPATRHPHPLGRAGNACRMPMSLHPGSAVRNPAPRLQFLPFDGRRPDRAPPEESHSGCSGCRQSRTSLDRGDHSPDRATATCDAHHPADGRSPSRARVLLRPSETQLQIAARAASHRPAHAFASCKTESGDAQLLATREGKAGRRADSADRSSCGCQRSGWGARHGGSACRTARDRLGAPARGRANRAPDRLREWCSTLPEHRSHGGSGLRPGDDDCRR